MEIENINTVNDLIKYLLNTADVLLKSSFRIYVTQVLNEGIIYTILFTFLTVILLVITRKLFRLVINDQIDDSDLKGLSAFGVVFLFLISLFLMALGIVPNILKILNPPYYAIDKILDILK